jgi:hypothetical protein
MLQMVDENQRPPISINGSCTDEGISVLQFSSRETQFGVFFGDQYSGYASEFGDYESPGYGSDYP